MDKLEEDTIAGPNRTVDEVTLLLFSMVLMFEMELHGVTGIILKFGVYVG